MPSKIEVPAGNTLFLVGHAIGVQIYSCNATAGGFAWTFVAPRANLYDDYGRRITTHYAGPTWEAKDASKVVGQRVDGVTVDPKAIPWLLLSATSTGDPGPARPDDVHPADRDARRPGPRGQVLQRVHGRNPRADPVHRGLLLLEEAGLLKSV